MTFDDVLVHPVMGPKPDALGNRCVMAANAPDFNFLHLCLKQDHPFQSLKLFMSRLNFGYENSTFSLLGPFMGGPYAVVLIESLIAWGVQEVIFLGWCGAISPDVRIGDVIIPDSAFCDDGTSKNYLDIPCDTVCPSKNLQGRIKTFFSDQHVGFYEGPVWSTDAIFRETRDKIGFFQKKNALAVEMEAAALFAAGQFRRIDVGCVLVVSDEVSSMKWKPGFRMPLFKQKCHQVSEILKSL